MPISQCICTCLRASELRYLDEGLGERFPMNRGGVRDVRRIDTEVQMCRQRCA